MNTNNKESRGTNRLERWKDYITWEYKKQIIDNLATGFLVGLLVMVIVLWYYFQKYPEVASLATTLMVIIFILLMIDIIERAYSIHKYVMNRDRFFRELEKLVKDYNSVLKRVENKRIVANK